MDYAKEYDRMVEQSNEQQIQIENLNRLSKFDHKTMEVQQEVIDTAKKQIVKLCSMIELLLENIEPSPAANCSCHICAPCGDCTDYAHIREVIGDSKQLVTESKFMIK